MTLGRRIGLALGGLLLLAILLFAGLVWLGRILPPAVPGAGTTVPAGQATPLHPRDQLLVPVAGVQRAALAERRAQISGRIGLQVESVDLCEAPVVELVAAQV